VDAQIIGLTGSIGSGCTYIAREILEKVGFKYICLSDYLKAMYIEEKGAEPSDPDKRKREYQEFGDKKRRENDQHDFFTQKAIEDIKREPGNQKWIVDSIRNPAEVHALRNHSQNFWLFGIFAGKETRWNRPSIQETYKDNKEQFEADDKNDSGEGNQPWGQKVSDCFSEADVVFENKNDFSVPDNIDSNKFKGSFLGYVERVLNPQERREPPKEEGLMAMAYAASQFSSCMQRKVGAVIVDEDGNVVSSGYNEVPKGGQTCREEYTECFRQFKRNKFLENLIGAGILSSEKEAEFNDVFKENFKILDLCRALHAEENAIINLARNGISVDLEKCTLYTTTHPCRLCANKIAMVGIKKIVYVEPYPDDYAIAILTHNGIHREFFKGITYKAYFKVYGEKK